MMSTSRNSKPLKVLLIGPLPPPIGGSTVSFERFLEHAIRIPELDVTHIDLPVHKLDADGQPSGVSPIRTLGRGLAALRRFPAAERVVLFSSRGLAFSFGLVIIAFGRLVGRPVYLRLFGGRPYARAASRKSPLRRLTEKLLSYASGISLETEVGRNDFPAQLRGLVKAVPGYRPRPDAAPRGSKDSARVRFAFAGRVDRSKGFDVLIKAADLLASRLPVGSFQIDCYGPTSSGIEPQWRNHPTVNLMGLVDNQRYRSLLASYDAFLYPSVYDNEGHPGAVIEAMLNGLPIVCTSLPAVGEIVSDGIEGLTVPSNDPESLAEAMIRIITDRGLRERLAAGSKARGLQFDEEVVIPRLLREMGLAD